MLIIGSNVQPCYKAGSRFQKESIVRFQAFSKDENSLESTPNVSESILFIQLDSAQVFPTNTLSKAQTSAA